ncbi:glycoside hydrolase family 32 protein [Bowmanella sp. Y26]|uniref:glycoside hydrolase family 32 protein n=1 Tax=Bowmanella yangjiangensis TaxID=2811230 RepID=UPI001BDC9B82|nr:glycoside hydrolase family 32 protein [Bowmanella yangjiangensis]MBT1063144.1 glycoside hydrolase family 32 protein [Bowmanella yangjiangensis]
MLRWGVLLTTVWLISLTGHTQELTAGDYQEPYRPQWHFSPPSGWMNDPNGLVYHQGEYHLFYQYYPDATRWGPMHWGHAVSRDLVHWQHLPIALAPDEKGYIFSGSIVADTLNTSGLGKDGVIPLVALFTYHDPKAAAQNTRNHESQGLAFSLDNGRSWQKYANNPVIPNPGETQDFRDPKVFWHAPSQHWVMALSVTDHVQFWRSKNLIDWQYQSSFGKGLGAQGGVWECPDLLPFTLPGSDQTHWALLLNLNPGGPQGGSGIQYFIGDFDGKTFSLDPDFANTLQSQEAVWLDHGADNYAGVTWSGVEDGRTLFIGWMSNWLYGQQLPTHPWRSSMTMPRTLDMVSTAQGLRLKSRPVAELESLRQPLSLTEHREANRLTMQSQTDIMQSEWWFEFRLPEQESILELIFSNELGEKLVLGVDKGQFYIDRSQAGRADFSEVFASRHRAPLTISDNALSIRLFLDHSAVEVFVNDGQLSMTERFFPTRPYTSLSISGRAELKQKQSYKLASIW